MKKLNACLYFPTAVGAPQIAAVVLGKICSLFKLLKVCAYYTSNTTGLKWTEYLAAQPNIGEPDFPYFFRHDKSLIVLDANNSRLELPSRYLAIEQNICFTVRPIL